MDCDEWTCIYFWGAEWFYLISLCVLVAQSCLTLCDSMDCSPPGFSVRGILQAKILEWVAFSFFKGSSWPGIKPGSPTLQTDSLLSEPPNSVQFSRSVVSDSLPPHELQHARLPCPSPAPRVHSDSCPLSQWCHPTTSSCRPLLLPSIFPSIFPRVFSNESRLHIRWL